ncbi:MAG: C39 family peptidase [Pseudomonadota bacterium]
MRIRRSFRSIAAALCAGSVLSACAAVPMDDERFQVSTHQGLIALDVPQRTLVETKFDTVVRQQFDFSCGSAALATLLSYHYGLSRGENDVFQGMWRDGDQDAIQRLGFSLLDMKRYLAAGGLKADGYRVNLEQIRKANTPGIALIAPDGYRHFVVVKGVEDGFVLVGDPSLGLRRMDRKSFEETWNGVYFVVTNGPKINHVPLNADAQWDRVAAFGVDHGAFQPVDQQALNLTAPGYGEF